MDTNSLPLPPDVRRILASHGGAPLRFEDPETHELYWLVEQPVEVTLDEDYILQGIQVGLDEFARGEFAPWDIEATIARAKQQRESRLEDLH
jgi:hypothetical protein